MKARSGLVQVRTPTGKLCAIQNGSVQCYGEDGTLAAESFGLFEDSKGNLWVGVQNGLWRWKPGQPKFYPLPASRMASVLLVKTRTAHSDRLEQRNPTIR